MFAVLRVGLIRAWFSVDGNVVHVYREPSLGHFSSKYCVHYHLEGGRGVSKAEEHDSGFEEAFWGEKRGLPLVPLFDANVVISPTNVELGE